MYAEINSELAGKIPFLPINIGEIKFQNKIQRYDGFPAHLIIWVTEGEGLFTADGKTKVLHKGQGIFARKTSSYAYEKSGKRLSTKWISFDGGDSVIDFYGIEKSLFFTVPTFLNRAADQLDALCRSSSAAVRAANTYLLLAQIFDSALTEKFSKVSSAEQFLESNFDSPLTLDDIAAHVGMNKFALCHLYSKEKGESVMQALKRIRIQKAKMFLLYSQAPIEEIGKMCGYDSGSYFTKIFRELEGCSPSEYRRNIIF